MVYVFTFLGEFGYELLNWQGVVRKFSRTIDPPDKIVCCGRKGLQPFYPQADLFIDVSAVELFRNSVACAYYALASTVYDFESRGNRLYSRRLKRALETYVLDRLQQAGLPTDACRFVFSSDKTTLNGCVFGVRASPYDPEYDIYDFLDTGNNAYARIEPVRSARRRTEEQLGFSLDEPFILCQMRQRSAEVPAGSMDSVPHEELLEPIARRARVVLLSFDTGRRLDSGSTWAGLPGASVFRCSSFAEQSCLIDASRVCLFFTEGDFGSHIYLPPMFGKDVFAVAPWTVYQLGTSPIEFWNREIFRFGGAIHPLVAEDVFASETSLADAVDRVCRAVAPSKPASPAGNRQGPPAP